VIGCPGKEKIEVNYVVGEQDIEGDAQPTWWRQNPSHTPFCKYLNNWRQKENEQHQLDDPVVSGSRAWVNPGERFSVYPESKRQPYERNE
jgi:hypothetical protein